MSPVFWTSRSPRPAPPYWPAVAIVSLVAGVLCGVIAAGLFS